MMRTLSSALLAASLLGAGAAGAAEPRPSPAADRGAKATSAPEAVRPVLGADAPAAKSSKIRAFHRVDVIAPGEKVETIFDCMRADHPQAEDESRSVLPLRVDRREPQGGSAGRPSPVVQPPAGSNLPTHFDHGHR